VDQPSAEFVAPDDGYRDPDAGVLGAATSPRDPTRPATGSRRMALRPMGVAEILDGSFTMIRRNPKVMLGLSALVAAVQVVIVTVLQVIALERLGSVKITDTAGAVGQTSAGPALGGEATQLISLAIGAALGAVLTGMLTVAITQEVVGNRLNAAQVWTRVRSRLWRLIALAVITAVFEIGGLILALAPGIWLWGVWAVATPVMMVEGATIRGALGRSRALVDGMFWRVWGIRALGFLVAAVLTLFVALPLNLIGVAINSNFFHANAQSSSNLPIAYLVLSAIGNVLAVTFTAPLRSGVDAFLYLDLRMRKEGLDIVMAQSAPGVAPAASAGPAGPVAPTAVTAF
jgi:hypothetical protein